MQAKFLLLFACGRVVGVGETMLAGVQQRVGGDMAGEAGSRTLRDDGEQHGCAMLFGQRRQPVQGGRGGDGVVVAQPEAGVDARNVPQGQFLVKSLPHGGFRTFRLWRGQRRG